LYALVDVCITAPHAYTYAKCLCAGADTITHHVDGTLGRSLLGRKGSGENRFNEQQVIEREGHLKEEKI